MTLPSIDTIRRGDTRGLRLWLGEPWLAPSVEFLWWRTETPFSFRLTLGEESGNIALNAGLWPGHVRLALCDAFRLPYQWWDNTHGRSTGIYFNRDPDQGTFPSLHDGFLHIEIWTDSMGWSSTQLEEWPWNNEGWSFDVHPLRWIFGREVYEQDRGMERMETVPVELPEGVYEATVNTWRSRHNRRWWNGTWRWIAEIEVDGGVPIPGKGTTADNCGDDAMHAISIIGTFLEGSKAEEPGVERPHSEDVAASFVEACLKTRGRYGGDDWTPGAGWPEHCQVRT